MVAAVRTFGSDSSEMCVARRTQHLYRLAPWFEILNRFVLDVVATQAALSSAFADHGAKSDATIICEHKWHPACRRKPVFYIIGRLTFDLTTRFCVWSCRPRYPTFTMVKHGCDGVSLQRRETRVSQVADLRLCGA